MWNLDEGKKADATIALRLPRGWTADRTRADVTIPQMADLSVTFKLMPAAAVLGPEKLLVEGHCDGHAMASMVSWFGRKPAAVKPAKAEDVVKESGPDWELASPAAGQPTTSFERLRPGVFRIKSLPSAPEKRAISLKLPLGQGTRLDEFDGLLVTVEPAAVKPSFRVTLSDAQAAAWECGSAGDGHAPVRNCSSSATWTGSGSRRRRSCPAFATHGQSHCPAISQNRWRSLRYGCTQ